MWMEEEYIQSNSREHPNHNKEAWMKEQLNYYSKLGENELKHVHLNLVDRYYEEGYFEKLLEKDKNEVEKGIRKVWIN